MSGPLWLGLSMLLSGCTLQQLSIRPEAVEPAQVLDQSQAVVQTVAASPAPPQPPPQLPGQDGPTAELLQGGDLRLTTRRSEQTFPDGNRIWMVELHRGDRLLARWKAASGIAQRQDADRLWSPAPVLQSCVCRISGAHLTRWLSSAPYVGHHPWRLLGKGTQRRSDFGFGRQ